MLYEVTYLGRELEDGDRHIITVRVPASSRSRAVTLSVPRELRPNVLRISKVA